MLSGAPDVVALKQEVKHGILSKKRSRVSLAEGGGGDLYTEASVSQFWP